MLRIPSKRKVQPNFFVNLWQENQKKLNFSNAPKQNLFHEQKNGEKKIESARV